MRGLSLAVRLGVGLAALGTVGCGQAPVEVTGTVTYRGKPVVYGTVNAIASDKMTHYAIIQPDGSFRFEKLPPGPATFGVVSPDPYFERSMTAEMKTELAEREKKAGVVPLVKPPKGVWFPIPHKYGDPLTSGFNADLMAPTTTVACNLN